MKHDLLKSCHVRMHHRRTELMELHVDEFPPPCRKQIALAVAGHFGRRHLFARNRPCAPASAQHDRTRRHDEQPPRVEVHADHAAEHAPVESRSKSISATEWRVSTPSFFASSASALTNGPCRSCPSHRARVA